MSEVENTSQVEQIDEDRRKLNRQINFYIMRYMWQAIKGRSPAGKGAAIYIELDTSRERYTRIIDGKSVRISQSELDEWARITGLPRGVFSGDICIKCAQYDEQGTPKAQYDEQGTPKEIESRDWSELFALRAERADTKGEGEIYRQAKSTYTEKEKEIQKRLKAAKRKDNEHEEFSKLCYWLTYLEPAPAKLQDEDVQTATEVLNLLTFRKLDDCEFGLLQKLERTLQSTHKLVKLVYEYKSRAREDEKKKKQKQ